MIRYMTGLNKIFSMVKNEYYNEQRIIINEWFHSKLKMLDDRNIAYGIFTGYYDYSGFDIDRQINGNDIGGVMIDDGFDFVDYLKNYYERLNYSAACQLQIRIDIDTTDNKILHELQYNIVFIEYNGYELFYDTY